LTKFQLAAIGAVALADNEVEVALDALLSAVVGVIMRIWLEYDAVTLAVLVFGIAAVEWLAFSI
jgi:hypothetical protein